MRWCRSCIRTRPSPRSTTRSRTTSRRGLVDDLDLDHLRRPARRRRPASTRAWPRTPVGVGAALHLDQQVAGGVHEVGGGRGAQQPPAVEDDDVVADPLQLAEQVGGHQDRDAELGADPADQRQHVVARGRVEAVGRLVEQHQPRVVDERLGELGPLLHAGGVAADRAVALLGQPDVAQHVGGALARGGVGQPGHLAHVDDQVAGGDVGRQAVVLGHVADERADPAPSVATSWPSTWAVPLVAGISPSRILISVDLPAPLAPTSPVTPSPTDTSSWSSAVTRGYRLVSPAVSMTPTATTLANARYPDGQAHANGNTSVELSRPVPSGTSREEDVPVEAEEPVGVERAHRCDPGIDGLGG